MVATRAVMEERGTCGLGTRRLIGGFAEVRCNSLGEVVMARGMVKMRWLTKIGSGEAVRKQLELGSESWWFIVVGVGVMVRKRMVGVGVMVRRANELKMRC
ncbi:unnamed protein product [Sphenostylis stenocarpa]|uniref:Uncharacterized protein n=1 Tax=Sphenostylis stenocarpa TaxID=92480 RepID=A0AA86SCE4_9FABA|nr:unnamed protein product [Sphenostylis stenocarpa]